MELQECVGGWGWGGSGEGGWEGVSRGRGWEGVCVRRGRGVRWVGVIVEVCKTWSDVCTEHVNVRTMKHIPHVSCVKWTGKKCM